MTSSNLVLRRAALRAVATALAGGGLTACGIFSSGKNKKVLPGTRISVLQLERELHPDVAAVDIDVILPRPEDTDSWPQAGGMSNHAMHHLVIGDNPKLLWRNSIGAKSGKRNRNLAPPVVADGIVYTIDNEGHVSAFNADNGHLKWRVKAPSKKEDHGSMLGGGLAIVDGKLFATGGFAEVVALDPRNGHVLWRAPTDSPIHSAPAVNGGRVFAITVENQVVAVAAENGAKLWSYSAATTATILLGGAAPAVDGGVVIAPFTNGELAALRVDNGTPVWNENVVAVRRTEAAASLPDVKAMAVIDRGRVYAVGHSGIMVAIDLRTGQRVWDAPVAGIYEPWIAGDFLYVISLDSELACIDVRSGHIIWVTQLPRYLDPKDKSKIVIWAGPALASDRLIVVGSTGKALSISPYSGTVMSELKLAAPAVLAPVFTAATMYLISDNGQITAYR